MSKKIFPKFFVFSNFVLNFLIVPNLLLQTREAKKLPKTQNQFELTSETQYYMATVKNNNIWLDRHTNMWSALISIPREMHTKTIKAIITYVQTPEQEVLVLPILSAILMVISMDAVHQKVLSAVIIS